MLRLETGHERRGDRHHAEPAECLGSPVHLRVVGTAERRHESRGGHFRRDGRELLRGGEAGLGIGVIERRRDERCERILRSHAAERFHEQPANPLDLFLCQNRRHRRSGRRIGEPTELFSRSFDLIGPVEPAAELLDTRLPLSGGRCLTVGPFEDLDLLPGPPAALVPRQPELRHPLGMRRRCGRLVGTHQGSTAQTDGQPHTCSKDAVHVTSSPTCFIDLTT